MTRTCLPVHKRAQIKAKIPSHQTNEKTDVGEGKEKEGEQIGKDDLIRKPVGYLGMITRMSMTIVMTMRKRTMTMMLMTDHHRLLELCWSWRGGSSDWGNFKVADLNIQVQFVVLDAKENLVSTCCSCWGAGTGRTLL